MIVWKYGMNLYIQFQIGYLMNGNRSFTLIELLIVVAIIGILATIAITNFLNAMIRSKIARSQSDMKALGIAIESFRADRNEMLVDDADEWSTEGLARLKRWGFCSPDNLDDTVRNQKCIMANLTFPISYISAIPTDPFFAKIAHSDNPFAQFLAGTYYYCDNDPEINGSDFLIYYLHPNAGIPPEFHHLQEGQWALMGIGPNEITMEKEGLTEEAVYFFNNFMRGLPYDITNGLISRGDIIIRGG